ncbi:MAG: hypothetical protein JO323_17855 [Acidobacteriia bacterium]|nr:hypothetical protein [Terriglobia bacterium]
MFFAPASNGAFFSIPLCQQCDYTFNVRLHFCGIAIGELPARAVLPEFEHLFIA